MRRETVGELEEADRAAKVGSDRVSGRFAASLAHWLAIFRPVRSGTGARPSGALQAIFCGFRGLGGRKRRRDEGTGAPKRLGGWEPLERRAVLAAYPFGALADDTAEYMLGEVAVTVVLMESDGSVAPPGVTPDPNTETWTSQTIAGVKTKVESAMQWWKETLANVSPTMANTLSFTYDYTYANTPVRTHMEPINRRSNDFQLWMYDFLELVGHDDTGDFSRDIRAFNDAQRRALGAQWAFTILVVNSTNDTDDSFAAGGAFSRAFAYAGGRFIVVPSDRPTSTYAHEVGHMFWARDEYSGEDWTTRRGYYNTQNSNAPRVGYTQLPSIMAAGQLLDQAFNNRVSAPSTLAMIGWQDSDGDGIFDVLDVPLSLRGTGVYDPVAGAFRFRGAAAVNTLPNRNSSGLQSDITINTVGRAEYRFDGGPWQIAATYGGYSANLDFSFAVPAGVATVELRVVDPVTTVSSPIFAGSLARPLSTAAQGVSGFVFRDSNADAAFANTESGWAGWTVSLVDAGGVPLETQRVVEPDDYAAGLSLGNPASGIRLSTIGWDANGSVFAADSPSGDNRRVFGTKTTMIVTETSVFEADARILRIDFDNPTTFVGIDAIGVDGPAYGRLEAFDANGTLLQRFTTELLNDRQRQSMSVRRDRPEIKYVLAEAHAGTKIELDRLLVGPTNAAVTDALGAYFLPALPAGQYTLRATPPASWTYGGATPADRTVMLGEGESLGQVDFAIEVAASAWHNIVRPTDVNNDLTVAPLDALLIINDININASRTLSLTGPGGFAPPPFLDVNNDGVVSPIDALIVINQLNSSAANGEAAPRIGPAMARVPSDGPAVAGGPAYADGPAYAGGEGDWAAWWNEYQGGWNAANQPSDPARASCRTLPVAPPTPAVRWSNDAEADAHWHPDEHDHDEHDHDEHDHDEHDHVEIDDLLVRGGLVEQMFRGESMLAGDSAEIEAADVIFGDGWTV